MRSLNLSFAAVVALTAVAATGIAVAQHAGHAGPAVAPTKTAGTSTKAYVAANNRMHKDMAIRYSGNADVDFVRGMIPHHQGAVDMAKVVLAHGKDPAIRKLAEDVIKSQEGEIVMMKDWLAKNAPAAAKK